MSLTEGLNLKDRSYKEPPSPFRQSDRVLIQANNNITKSLIIAATVAFRDVDKHLYPFKNPCSLK